MAVTQYVGARYVPLFADPIEWDSQYAYEPLTIVLHEGNSYTSRQYVPKGIDISDDKFWAETGNYNAQVEQYRQEVQTFDERITNNSTNIELLKNTLMSGIKCIAFGDSTGTLTSSPKTFFQYLEDYSGCTVENKCVAGSCLTPKTYGTIDESGFYKISSQFNKIKNYDIIFMAYGTNDWQNSRPLRMRNSVVPNENDISYETCLYNLLYNLSVKCPNTKVVFITPAGGYHKFSSTPSGVEQGTVSNLVNTNLAGFNLGDVVDMTLKVCAHFNVSVVDLYHEMGITPQNIKDNFVNDSGGIFVHYNTSLKQKIGSKLYREFPYSQKYENPTTAAILTTSDFVMNRVVANETAKTLYNQTYSNGFVNDGFLSINLNESVKSRHNINFNINAELNIEFYTWSSASKIEVYIDSLNEDYAPLAVLDGQGFHRLTIPAYFYRGMSTISLKEIGASTYVTNFRAYFGTPTNAQYIGEANANTSVLNLCKLADDVIGDSNNPPVWNKQGTLVKVTGVATLNKDIDSNLIILPEANYMQCKEFASPVSIFNGNQWTFGHVYKSNGVNDGVVLSNHTINLSTGEHSSTIPSGSKVYFNIMFDSTNGFFKGTND